MAEVQFFGAVSRSAWEDDELADAVQSASAHVRYLLRELSENGSVRASDLKSKRVAYAIVQRICNSSSKDSLVIADEEEGEKVYSLNPRYRTKLAPLVKDAPEPPPTPARPRRKKVGVGRGRRQLSATDGIADPRGGQFSYPGRQVTQASGTRFIHFPEGTALEFCQELMAFLNSSSPSTRYRVVLDATGPRLEIA